MTVTIQELTNHSYIDHELSATLDSSEAFEGPEKLLEIWFYPSAASVPKGADGVSRCSLRDIAFEKWVAILKLVKCEVLSIKSTEKMDAFLLSESSLFVCDHKLTLKTCGTTTTLFCLEELFRIVQEELKWDMRATAAYQEKDQGQYHPYKVFYSRRCFMFPLKQRSIHKRWTDEIEYLNKFFCHGSSYLVGRSDQSNHWNLYVTETNKAIEEIEDSASDEDEDETLEILMTGLDPKCAQQFVCKREVKTVQESQEDTNTSEDEGHLLGYKMTNSTKLDKVYNNSNNVSFHHDAFAFTPCGYSSNIVLDEQYYYTLHVTPEKGWSYASFESNVPVEQVSSKSQDNVSVVNHVLSVFQPKDVCLTFFSKSMENDSFQKLMKLTKLANYAKKDRIIYDLDDYHLLYIRFERTSNY
ncbi:S-adenosylmethionine decarboxylase proenzyme [Nakaseomyces bracarensis]|uniref:adenosylmethionine decarboxylase n=1 Tax=Nakaseomyces bracarensis TaxID=273131 RepID=A0ABR4NQ59_9SACH